MTSFSALWAPQGYCCHFQEAGAFMTGQGVLLLHQVACQYGLCPLIEVLLGTYYLWLGFLYIEPCCGKESSPFHAPLARPLSPTLNYFSSLSESCVLYLEVRVLVFGTARNERG